MDTIEELTEKAIKALSENLSFNEIELCDGGMRVHLVRVTPVPWYYQPGPWVTPFQYPGQYKQP